MKLTFYSNGLVCINWEIVKAPPSEHHPAVYHRFLGSKSRMTRGHSEYSFIPIVM